MTVEKIAFTGPYSDVNFGDYAMLVNNIYDLDINDVTVFSYDDTFLNEIVDGYLQDFNIKITSVYTKEINKKKNYSYTPMELLEFVENKHVIQNRLLNIDVLIVNGGGYFNGLWSMPHRFEKLIKIIAPILIADSCNIPIYFTANSYGPYGDDSELFSNLFSSLRNATFSVRDQLFSPKWFNQLGVNRELEFIPDDLMFINNKIINKKKKFQIDSNKYIVVETYLPIEYIQSNLGLFKKLSEFIKQNYDLSIVFLPLNLNHGGVDQGKLLESYLGDFEFIDITDNGYLPIEDAVEIIKNAELVISSRYHSLVLALINEVPAVSAIRDVMNDKTYYYNKNYGLIRQLFKGLPIPESVFIFGTYSDALTNLIHNFNYIKTKQEKLFKTEEYKNNREILFEKRKEYFWRIKGMG